MPTSVIRKAESWGKKAKHDALKQKVEFLNRNKKKFDWDTDKEPNEGLLEYPPTYLGVPAEEPVVPLETEYDDPMPTVTEDTSSLSDQASAALANDGSYQVPRVETAGVHHVSDDAQEWNVKVEPVYPSDTSVQVQIDNEDEVTSTASTVHTSNQ